MQGQGTPPSLHELGLSSGEEDNIAEGPEDLVVIEVPEKKSKEVRDPSSPKPLGDTHRSEA